MAAAAAKKQQQKKKQAVQVHLKETFEVKRWCARVTLKSKGNFFFFFWWGCCLKEALLKRHTSLKHLLVVVL